MLGALLSLFIITLLSGVLTVGLPQGKPLLLSSLLVLSGSYLFSFTLVHLLPMLFALEPKGTIGLYLCAGFFFQLFLDGLSHGLAHAHQPSSHEPLGHVHPWRLFLALGCHALLDGFLLGVPALGHHLNHGHTHAHASTYALLLGMILHKLPVAFTLGTVLSSSPQVTPVRLWGYLALFAAVTPLGWMLSGELQASGVLSPTALVALAGGSTGSLLHVGTTILFESSPGHQMPLRKCLLSLVGALLALGINYAMEALG